MSTAGQITDSARQYAPCRSVCCRSDSMEQSAWVCQISRDSC